MRAARAILERQEASLTRAGAGLRMALMFLGGLSIGLLLFMPWRPAWESAARFLASRVDGVSVGWSEITQAGPFSATYKNFIIDTQRGSVTLPELRLGIGLFPLFRAQVNTGPALDLSMGFGRTLTYSGGLEMSALMPQRGVKGLVTAEGDLFFPSPSAPPESGTMKLGCQSLTVSGATLTGLALRGSLSSGNKLNIESLTLAGPTPAQAKGTAEINWKDPLATSYSISGTATVGDTKQNFTRQGRLISVFSE